MKRERRHRSLSGLGIIGATLMLGAGSITPAAAIPTTVDPTDPAVAAEWINPAVRPGQADSDIELDVIAAPTLADGPAHLSGTLTMHVRLRNTAAEESDTLTLAARRAEAIGSPEAARWALAADNSTYGYYGETLELDPLDPGEERTVALRIPLQPEVEGGLSIVQPGVYPVMFALSGPEGEVTTERFLLPVAPTEPASSQEEDQPGLTLLYPVTAPLDIVPGETGSAPEEPPLLLMSEQLADQLAPGGRVRELLGVYAQATSADPALGQASCLALDPALVQTIDRMSRGYTVTSERQPIEAPQRLRDSWFTTDDDIAATPGRGAEDAAAVLTMLTEIAATGCIVALPWAGTDVQAVAHTQDTWLIREALERGPHTLHAVLGESGVLNTVLDPTGYVDQATVPYLNWADHAAHRLAEGGMSAQWEQASHDHTAVASSGSPVSVIVSDNTVPGEGPNRELPEGPRAVTFPSSLGAVLASVGTHPETVGYSNPQTRYDYSVDSVTSRAISAGSTLRIAVASATDPVLAPLPLTADPRSAEYILRVASALLADASATPLSLTDRLALPAEPAGEGTVGSPFPDPSAMSDAEITRVQQQGQYLDDLTRLMNNDPAIALTRYGFTRPLRQELVRALARGPRSSYHHYVESTARTSRALDAHREVLQMMRASVNLIPPGNVYTRTSQSSPLLIVAQNGLPLPVSAAVSYHSDDDVILHVPSPLRIPAQGSITVEMTAELPNEDDATEIRLWLSTQDGAAISAPVDIAVQTRAGTTALLSVAGGLIALLFVLLIIRRQRSKKQAAS